MLPSYVNTLPEEHADSTCAHAEATGASERVRDALLAWCASLLRARRVAKATGTALAVMCNPRARAYRGVLNGGTGVSLWRAARRRRAVGAVVAGRAAATGSTRAAGDGIARASTAEKVLQTHLG